VRKEIKAVVKALEAAQAYHPAMKRLPKAFEDYMGKLDAASQFMGQEEREVEAMKTTKQHAEYYLKHQKRMIELARVRAEANEKLAAENKGK
jgi:tryptophan 2,3-dioxygenase